MRMTPFCTLIMAGSLALPLALAAQGDPKEGGKPVRVKRAPGAAPHVGMPDGEVPPPATMSGKEVVLPILLYGSRPQVDVRINGEGPYRFILDSGSHTTLIDEKLAGSLSLPVIGEAEIASPAGGTPRKASRVSIESASVGGVTLGLSRATTMDLAGYLRDDEGPKGILGGPLFRGLLLSFDYPNDVIRITRGQLGPADGREVFEYGADDALPTIPLELAGQTIEAHLDTGSPGGITLPGSWAERLPLESRPREIGRARLLDREMPILTATLDGNASIGGHVFARPELRFGEFFPVGNVGHGILQDFVVTLDFEHRRIRLGRPDAAPAAAGGA